MKATDICPYTGLTLKECKEPQGLVNLELGTPLCDCWEYEIDEIQT